MTDQKKYQLGYEPSGGETFKAWTALYEIFISDLFTLDQASDALQSVLGYSPRDAKAMLGRMRVAQNILEQ